MTKINLLKSILMTGAVLSSGCVMKQSVDKYEKVILDKGAKSQREVEVSYVSYEDGYTFLGNAVNTVSGMITGFVNCGVDRAQKNYQETTNGVPVVWPVIKGGYGLVSGALVGAAEGGYEGWNATYSEVREQNKKQNGKIDRFLNQLIDTLTYE